MTVVNLTEYRNKGVLTLFRELFLAASKGKIAGARVVVEFKDGGRQKCAAGKSLGGNDHEDCCGDSPCARRLRQ